ncbi:MAG: hypothetical protein HY815_04545 [Candidatus Riflebacteria bacterium]|nr:hypothetical protein [Candidatus Riflebacteria bacterium]
MRVNERPGRRGLSMLELALSFTILALAIVPILNVVFGTNRLQHRVTGVFREAVAGQLVWEAIKGRNQIDETFLRDLALGGFETREVADPRRPGRLVRAHIHLGSFVERGGPLDRSGRPVSLSPLVSHLITRTGGAIAAPANRAPLEPDGPSGNLLPSELTSLHHNFKDLAFQVTVMDGVLPRWTGSAPEANAPLALSELVQDVSIEVCRTGPDRRLLQTPAFQIDGALETPSGSLPPSRLRALVSKRDTYSFDDDFRGAYRKMAPRALEEGQTENVARALANLLLIVVESVGESTLTQGDDFGFGVRRTAAGRGTDYWVDQALSRNTNLCRVVAADLLVEKARGILAAYRRSERPMTELAAYARDFGDRLLRAADEFDRLRRLAAVQPNVASGEAPVLRKRFSATIKEAQFCLKFFSQESYARSMLWPGSYAARFDGEALSRAQDLYSRVDSDSRSTPMDRMRAITAYVQVLRARKMFLNRLHLPADERLITERAAEYRGTMRPFADSLLADEVFDLNALVNRNVEFSRIVRGMSQIGEGSHPYQVILRNLHPNGLIGQAERRLTSAIDFFGPLHPQGDLTDDLGGAVTSTVNDGPSPQPSSSAPASDDPAQ